RRAAAAEVALARLVRARQREDGAERTCDGAKMAADAEVAEYYFRLRHRINGNGIDRAGVHAPRLVALRAGVRRVAGFLVKNVDTDHRARRLEHPGLHPGASQLALHAAGALVGDDLEAFGHVCL